MKKILLSVALLSLIVVTSCKEKEVISTSETETIVEEAPETEYKSVDTVSVTTEEADGTSVKMNGDGVSVDTKDGSKKTNVEINGGGAAVEVKK